MGTTEVIFILEVVGTIAFALAGAMIAVEKNMDIFGVNVLGLTTAVGGGMIRDLILGIHPPNMFRNPVYAVLAVCVSSLLFITIYYFKRYLTYKFRVVYDKAILTYLAQVYCGATRDMKKVWKKRLRMAASCWCVITSMRLTRRCCCGPSPRARWLSSPSGRWTKCFWWDLFCTRF